MRAFGVLLWVVAALCFMGAFGMDTSVPTETGKRVHNIGLMRDQENAVLLGIGLFIAGAIFIALGGKKITPLTSPSPTGTESDAQDAKKCPFCAEMIKREAIKCRFCGSELPVEPKHAEAVSAGSKTTDSIRHVAEWRGATLTHEFLVKVRYDQPTDEYVAMIEARSPAALPETRRNPGQSPARVNFAEPEELRHQSLERLRELTKRHITETYGVTPQFLER